MEKTKSRTKSQDVWKRLCRNKAALISLFVIMLLIFVAIFADVLFNYQEDVIRQEVPNRLQPPSAQHWFGTDDLGRDVFARVLYGTRVSLTIGFVTIAISMGAAIALGAIAGYSGGAVDNAIMRVTDVFLAIPNTLLVIALVAALGINLVNLVIAIAITYTPGFIRVVRASVLTIKGNDYIEAAKALGATNRQIITKHVIANSLAPIIVQATLGISSIIIAASSLSYIGLGVQPPTPEWGNMLSQGKTFMRTSPHLMFFPGLFIFITSLAFNLLGDGLRDALDPKLKN